MALCPSGAVSYLPKASKKRSSRRRTDQQTQAGVLHARTTLASKITSHSSPHHICALTPRRVWRHLEHIQRKRYRRSSRTAVIHWIPSVKSDTLMAATVEELYRNYGILADAKEDLSKVNKASYVYVVRLEEKYSLDIQVGWDFIHWKTLGHLRGLL